MAFLRLDFYSEQIQMNTSVNIVIPDGVPHDEMNVVYLLHGLSDNCTGWARLTSIERYANAYRCAVIMPEVQRSFYTDMAYGVNYFSYVSRELPEYICKMFGFRNERDKCYVAGLSMGGYGALKCALTYPEQYRCCAAFSSACDVEYNIKEKYIGSVREQEMKAVYGMELKVSDENNIFKLASKAAKSEISPDIFMTCGDVDLLLEQNERCFAFLKEQGLNAEFKLLKGDHTWELWDMSIQMAFERFFGDKTGGTKTPLSDGK